jgi:hypothetical protein
MKKKLDFEIVDDKILKNYYNDLKLLEKQNKLINNTKLLTNVPCSIRKKLLEQERKFTNKQNEENNIIKMSNLLCKLTKKNMKDLLMHQGDSFQFKSQAIRTLDTFKQSHGSFSSGSNWIHSLRYHNNKSKQNDLINKFINIRNTLNPLWIVDNDLNKSLSLKQHNEIKCKPRMLSNNIYRNYIKKPIMKSEMKKNFSMKKLESLKNIEINGINLLQLESENESKIPGKKKLYKQNQLDTINIKTANQNEFHREYTKMINEQIIAKDYS